jgi:hypothetical protein
VINDHYITNRRSYKSMLIKRNNNFKNKEIDNHHKHRNELWHSVCLTVVVMGMIER